MSGSPYAGRRPPTASVKLIDEDRVVKRYQQTRNMAQVARELGIKVDRVRAILDARSVARGKPEPDDDAILRNYDRTSHVHATAQLLSISEERVRAVLDAHGVPHAQPGAVPPLSTAQTRQQVGEKRRQKREPAATDLLRAGEAAQIAGVSTTALMVAVAHGVLVNRGSTRFPRYRRDEVTALAARRNTGSHLQEEDSSDQ